MQSYKNKIKGVTCVLKQHKKNYFISKTYEEYKKIKHVEGYAVDSYKIMIPIEKVEWYNKIELDPLGVFDRNTLEVSEEIEYKQVKYFYEDISLKIQLIEKYCFKKKRRAKWIEIQPNAKGLKNKYHEGIKKNNAKNMYEFIIESNLIKISEKVFMTSFMTDVDIKKDVKSKHKETVEIFKNIKENERVINSWESRPQRRDGKYTNLMGSFGNRKGVSKKSTFIKFYQKDVEFINNRKKQGFRNRFYNQRNFENILRIEYQIKNNKTFKKIFPEKVLTLETLVNLTEEENIKIYKEMINIHLNLENKPKREMENEDNDKLLIYKISIKRERKEKNITESHKWSLNKMELIDEIKFHTKGTEKKDKRYREIKKIKEAYEEVKNEENADKIKSNGIVEKWKEIFEIS